MVNRDIKIHLISLMRKKIRKTYRDNADEDLEKKEPFPFSTVGEHASLFTHCGKQHGGASKT